MNILKALTLADNISELDDIAHKFKKDEKLANIYEEAWKNRLENKAIEDEARLSQKIFQAVSILNLSVQIEKNFNEFANKVLEIIDFDNISLAILDEKMKDYKIYGAQVQKGKCANIELKKFPLEKTSIGWVCKTKKHLIINDLVRRTHFIEDEYVLNVLGIRSGIRFPLINNNKVIGVILLCSKDAKKYSNHHIRFCKILSEQLTAVIKNNFIYESMKIKKQEAESTKEKLKAVNALLEILAQQRSVDTLLETAFIKILSIFQREAGTIYLLEEKAKKLTLSFSYGLSEEFCKLGRVIDLGRGNTGKAVATGKTIIANDLNTRLADSSLHTKEGLISVCYIPLRAKKHIIGVLNIGSKSNRPFTGEEIEILEVLSEYLALFVERLAMLEKISELASIDSLSGLYNRTTFFKELDTQLSRANRYGEKFSILMMDIDFFKKYNDSFGHVVGDKLIKKLGKIIKNTIREGDIAARYGGEEFAIISYNTNSEEAFQQAERLRGIIEQKFKAENITMSIGVASYPDDAIDEETLVRRADKALYEAKKCNRNCVKEFRNIAENT